MKRRSFIKVSLAAGTAPLIHTGCTDSKKKPNKYSKITGFIFSDAHIGWRNKTQPSLDTQALMIERIKNFFPDLDLVFDTGDIHHGYLKEPERMKARDFWLSKMAGQFPTSLLHYIPGNHELGRGRKDAEITAAALGSMNFRPYYSFDYKGIHFVALPQLLNTVLISRESLNWLKQDLLINKDKTTLIFSHNSLQDTTFTNNETGYRVTVNSNEVYEVINQHNNVIGWFHGHNHQYEIVKKDKRLYVSNGRIGGFNPPDSWGEFGQGHLGGIYFEIDQNGLNVKCFSASENAFLEDLGYSHLSNTLKQSTSFQSEGKTNYYWGHGKLSNNVQYDFYNHFLTNETPLAIVAPNIDTVINENNKLNYETDFYFAGRSVNKVIGFQLLPRKLKSKNHSTGMDINTSEHNKIQIKFPVESYKFKGYLTRSGYYRCTKNEVYTILASFSNIKSDTVINYRFKVLDIMHNACFTQSIFQPLKKQNNQYEATIQVPNKLSTQPTDDRLYLFITLEVINPGKKLTIHNINLSQVTNPSTPAHKSLNINGEHLTFSNGNLLKESNNLKSPNGYLSVTDNQASHTLLAVTPNVQWQIRNATAQLINKEIHIQSLRHTFQSNREIIITPTSKRSNYINRLNNVKSCIISYTDSKTVISNIEADDVAYFTINTPHSNLKVTGSSSQLHKIDSNSIKVTIKNLKNVTLSY